jgi:hypothetical protein
MWYLALNIVKVYLQINTSFSLIKMGVDMFVKSIAQLLT